jgi:hypothetical protein
MTSPVMQQARLTARRHAEQVTRAHLEAYGIYDQARPARPFRLRLWLPVSLLWILFPLILLLSPLALAWRASPGRLVSACAALMAGLAGIRVEVETPDVNIHIRLF